MIIICCTDEFVIRSIQHIADLSDLTCYLIYKFLWRYACFLCFELDLLTMLICTGLEEYIVSVRSFETCDRIRQYDLIAVPDMRFA